MALATKVYENISKENAEANAEEEPEEAPKKGKKKKNDDVEEAEYEEK